MAWNDSLLVSRQHGLIVDKSSKKNIIVRVDIGRVSARALQRAYDAYLGATTVITRKKQDLSNTLRRFFDGRVPKIFRSQFDCLYFQHKQDQLYLAGLEEITIYEHTNFS